MILCVRFRLEPMHEALLPRLVALLGEFTPVVEAAPPDTLLADVRGALRYFGWTPTELASVVRVRALALYGVDCAVGVGPNPMLARMAAREALPGTTPVVEDPAAFLRDRPVVALDGVGRALARTLCGYGLDSVGRVADAPLAVLQRLVGAKAGRDLSERARGIDRTPVVPNAVSRSTAAERSFPHDELGHAAHRRALLSLADELGARMRAEGQVCRSLTVTVRYADRSVTSRTRTLSEPTAHSVALTALAYTVHASFGLQRARVRGITLRAEGLSAAEKTARQLSFDPADEKARRIEAVADRARAKFGPRAVLPGSLAA
ncbi:DNA polymerase thumb domain-containing protein [Streptomyces sp. NPDC085614]|uniref:DNA polymerase Y family protein n=1 Tax=Streptomyces sp. NPDC085614 TaxID=3365733 RepID=UPI0037CF1A4E